MHKLSTGSVILTNACVEIPFVRVCAVISVIIQHSSSQDNANDHYGRNLSICIFMTLISFVVVLIALLETWEQK